MSTVYWIAEYASSFIETFTCFVFCGTFIDREKIKTKKQIILLLSVISATVTTVFNTITFFSGITAFLGAGLLLILQYIVYRRPFKPLIFAIAFFAIITTVDLSVIYSISYVSNLLVADVIHEHTLARLTALIFTKTLLIINLIVIQALISGQ